MLVATDCLSEGVNLQHIFDAVVHYDLAWNPTRHEQREGRVDRYGQTSPEVRTVLLYGQDNRVDGVVLEVLLRKAELIRKTLGVSVPVPADTDKILEAIFDKLFDRPGTDYQQLELFVTEQQHQLDSLWRAAEEREKRTRTVFAQYALKPEEVRAELDEALAAVGTSEDVRWFVEDAFIRLAHRPANAKGLMALDLAALPAVLRSRLPDALRTQDTALGMLHAGFEPAVPKGAVYLPRTHPLIETIGSYLLDTALDEPQVAKAARAGAMRTAAVTERTVLLLLRCRYVISETRQGETRELLGEEALLTGFRKSPDEALWLEPDEAERLAREARPVANVLPEQAQSWVGQMIDALPLLEPALDALAQQRAQELLAAHSRVRAAAALRGVRQQVEAKLPVDVLGIYVLQPSPVATGEGRVRVP